MKFSFLALVQHTTLQTTNFTQKEKHRKHTEKHRKLQKTHKKHPKTQNTQKNNK